MYLSEVKIEVYEIFKTKFSTKLIEGLTVIVRENGNGKSAIIDSIRVLLSEDEFGRVGIGESDFQREITKLAKKMGVDQILIKGLFMINLYRPQREIVDIETTTGRVAFTSNSIFRL